MAVQTERRTSEQARLGRDLFALAQRLDDALVVLQPPAPTYANPAAQRLLERLEGPATDERCGERLLALMPFRLGDGEHVNRHATVHLTTAAGERCILQVTEVPLGDGVPGARQSRCLLLRDVTVMQQREEELQRRHAELQQAYLRLAGAQEQLLQSEKMASIGQLAAGVAHEINNPIGYVNSNLATLQDYLRNLLTLLHAYERVVPPGSAIEAATEIAELRERFDLDFMLRDLPELVAESREGIERVTKIVQDLKDFSRAGRGESWVMADLHKGLDSTLNIVWNELKYKVRLEKSYGELPAVECLPSELNQVFMNILVNAGQAIPERGHITIATGHDGGEVWVSIRDDGEGIPEAVLPRIFDPFFTTKPVGRGSGLGLSISYGIVAKHHGRIEVDSAAGRGTTFRVVLPVRQPRNEAEAAA
ncbi:MAG TPA: ATP-binding protein [Lysobacter sp.]|nr:ATP-binding protein [Lysobacter sp.]